MQPLPDMNKLMQIMASPAGQKLLSVLKNDPAIDLKKLEQEARSGDMTALQTQLSDILESAQVRQLLQMLEKQYE